VFCAPAAFFLIFSVFPFMPTVTLTSLPCQFFQVVLLSWFLWAMFCLKARQCAVVESERFFGFNVGYGGWGGVDFEFAGEAVLLCFLLCRDAAVVRVMV
jgi:hypothetical protein